MGNHFHLLVQTPEGNLCLNGVYTQRVNRRRWRVGHVFQGRYKAVLVDRDSYLLELAHYVELNPVRAGMVNSAANWVWSSYRAAVGTVPAPHWLAVDALLSQFGDRKAVAVRRYVDHVRAGVGLPSIWALLNRQAYLGDEVFVASMQHNAAAAGSNDALEIPRAQRRLPAKPLAHYVSLKLPRNKAIARAYASGDYSMAEVADAFAVHYSTVSRAVGQASTGAV